MSDLTRDCARLPCSACADLTVDTYVDGGVRKYASHRAPEDYPTWCDASDVPVSVVAS